MIQHTSESWDVTFELVLKEEFEKIISNYSGKLANQENRNLLWCDINHFYYSIFPDKLEINLDNSIYILESFDVSFDDGDVNISPKLKNIKFKN